MKIETLKISNFRGIREVELRALGSMVIIAGQNGSGKSCIFDGIRLLKSVYGGYQQNEWQQWMGEFQIQLSNRSADFLTMFNDRSKELRISCEFKLADEERTYISVNAEELLRELTWRTILPEAYDWGGYRMATFASQIRDREPEVRDRVAALKTKLMKELAGSTIHGECFIPVGKTPLITPSVALSVIFSTFRPRDIGVIDYHGAQRHYGREFVQGINLNLDANVQQRGHSSLYNSAAKYNNVKSEMAASYLRELLAEKAGVPNAAMDTLTSTLQELFETFFPDKTFLGPQATAEGSLSFPVRYGAATHDLDELSAGEKEILYGYLRIRNSAPLHSIILIDEPELHLNPRLIRGLPQFYHKNLGQALGNQLWLVSHSDALLRQVVGKDTYNVFHMLPCNMISANESQLKPLAANADLERALVDLVGDLAAYRPTGKVVIFEGGGDSDYDQSVTASLFPALQEQANLISGSNKTRVRALHETLERAAKRGQLPFQFFAVTDRDSIEESNDSSSSINTFSWDVYHLENYFVSPRHISQVLGSLAVGRSLSEEEIADELRQCARETLPQLLRHELGAYANTQLISAINTGTDPSKGDLVMELHNAVERSVERIGRARENPLSESGLRTREYELRSKYETGLADGSWMKIFRGRDILKRFSGKHASGVTYEAFRNLIVGRMRDENYQPPGMKAVIDKILEA